MRRRRNRDVVRAERGEHQRSGMALCAAVSKNKEVCQVSARCPTREPGEARGVWSIQSILLQQLACVFSMLHVVVSGSDAFPFDMDKENI